ARAAEPRAQPPDRALLQGRRVLLEAGGVALALAGEAEDQEESVGSGIADREELRRQRRCRDVLPESPRHGGQDAVVLLPPVQLLEPQETTDLEIHQAEAGPGPPPP